MSNCLKLKMKSKPKAKVNVYVFWKLKTKTNKQQKNAQNQSDGITGDCNSTLKHHSSCHFAFIVDAAICKKKSRRATIQCVYTL